MMGNNFEAVTIAMTLGKTILRKKTKRMSLIPVTFEGFDKVMPVEYHGSAHINALCQADAILTIPVGVAKIKEGTTVNVRQI